MTIARNLFAYAGSIVLVCIFGCQSPAPQGSQAGMTTSKPATTSLAKWMQMRGVDKSDLPPDSFQIVSVRTTSKSFILDLVIRGNRQSAGCLAESIGEISAAAPRLLFSITQDGIAVPLPAMRILPGDITVHPIVTSSDLRAMDESGDFWALSVPLQPQRPVSIGTVEVTIERQVVTDAQYCGLMIPKEERKKSLPVECVDIKLE